MVGQKEHNNSECSPHANYSRYQQNIEPWNRYMIKVIISAVNHNICYLLFSNKYADEIENFFSKD